MSWLPVQVRNQPFQLHLLWFVQDEPLQFLLSFKQWAKEWGLPLLSGLQLTDYFGSLNHQMIVRKLLSFSYFLLCYGFPQTKIFQGFWVFGLSGMIYHICLIGWMRHITLEGMLLASCLLSVYYLPWFLLARVYIVWSESILWQTVDFLICLPALGSYRMASLSVHSGFWCPLSVTQWERPMILQSVAWCGSWCVSFFLVTFNLCIVPIFIT